MAWHAPLLVEGRNHLLGGAEAGERVEGEEVVEPVRGAAQRARGDDEALVEEQQRRDVDNGEALELRSRRVEHGT